jgi:hypothetical protein
MKTIKEKVLAMIQRLGDDATYELLIYKLEFMKAVEEGIRQADAGNVIDDKDFWEHFEALDGSNHVPLVVERAQRSPDDSRPDRARNGKKAREAVHRKDPNHRKKPQAVSSKRVGSRGV